MRVAALAPKVEAMEASWNRIRTISGADTPDDVIAYWEGEHPCVCAVSVCEGQARAQSTSAP